MNALEKLKAACLKKSSKSFKSFKDLKVGEYIVYEFSWIQTNHGRRVRITLDDYFMYLPERFSTNLDDATIAELNSSPKVMVYGGKNPTEYNRLILDFHEVDYLASQMFQNSNWEQIVNKKINVF